MVKAFIRPLALTLLAAACGSREPAHAQTPTPPIAPQINQQRVNQQIDDSRRTALVTATARVAPSVVSVRVVTAAPQQSEMTAWFFGPQAPRQSFGTGFIVRDDGIVITNQHVVAGAEQITVTLTDGRDVDARLLGEDPLTDIAVLKVNDSGALSPAPIGTAADLQVGEWAIALGNPFSFLLGNSEPTVTAGVISGIGRNIMPTGRQQGRYYDMIQTDAAINPGNSGGPLINALGEVIGVSSSIFSNTGESVGVGFAIPIDRAIKVAEQIIRDGAVRRAWVGLDVAGPTQMGDWKSAGGVRVTQVVPGGPAAQAGLEANDVLLTANGRRLRNFLDWEAVLLDLHIGDRVDLSVQRGGREMDRQISPADLPSVTAERVRLRGLDLGTLTPAIRAELGVSSQAGAVLLGVPEETRRLTRLREGMVIVRIDYNAAGRLAQAPIASAQDMVRTLDRVPRGQPFRLVYEEAGSYYYLDLTN